MSLWSAGRVSDVRGRELGNLSKTFSDVCSSFLIPEISCGKFTPLSQLRELPRRLSSHCRRSKAGESSPSAAANATEAEAD